MISPAQMASIEHYWLHLQAFRDDILKVQSEDTLRVRFNLERLTLLVQKVAVNDRIDHEASDRQRN